MIVQSPNYNINDYIHNNEVSHNIAAAVYDNNNGALLTMMYDTSSLLLLGRSISMR